MPDKWIAGSGSGNTADAISAVNYSVLHGAQVSSNSWHVFEDSQGLYDAIAHARDAGDLFVAAAGSDGRNTDQFANWPSIYVRTLDNIISVAATDNRDAKASFSKSSSRDNRSWTASWMLPTCANSSSAFCYCAIWSRSACAMR